MGRAFRARPTLGLSGGVCGAPPASAKVAESALDLQEPTISPEIQDGTLSIRVLEEDSIRTLALAGELDLANAATLAAQLEERTAGELVLDMSGLEFIDSTGIALLVATHLRLNGEKTVGFRLIASESPTVRRVMALTGLDTELPFSGNGHLEPNPGTA